MVYCGNCGAELNQDSAFCEGAALKPSLHGLRTRTHIVERIP